MWSFTYDTVSLFIFAAIFSRFAYGVPVCGDLFLRFTSLSHYRVALMEVFYFRGDKFSRKYLPREYCEIK